MTPSLVRCLPWRIPLRLLLRLFTQGGITIQTRWVPWD
jgi:hypothetical protein